MTSPQPPSPRVHSPIDVMPLQVRLAAAVCACGCLAQEHNYSQALARRTACSRALGCECAGWTHTRDRYAVSTYIDVLAGDGAPQLGIFEERQR